MKKRISIFAGSAIAGILILLFARGPVQTILAADSKSSDVIRPFRVHISQAVISDLRKRIAATRWPDMETVSDQSQGVKLAKLKKLVNYWGTSL